MKRKYSGFILILSLIVLASCTTTQFMPSGQIRSHQYLPAEQELLETGQIAFHSNKRKVLSFTDPEQIMPSDNTEIIIQAQLKTSGTESSSIKEETSNSVNMYKWVGYIRFAREELGTNLNLVQRVREGGKAVELSIGQYADEELSFKLLETLGSRYVQSFPYKFAEIYTKHGRYYVYAVNENVYIPKDRYKAQWENRPAPYTFNPGIETVRMSGQIFQIVDKYDELVATVSGDSFELYNNIPEDEYRNMKSAIALIWISQNISAQLGPKK